VSVCQDCRRDNVGCQYLHFPLADDLRSKRSYGGSVDYESFYAAAQRVIERVEQGNVLVHCHAGRNRSAAVCAAVIAALSEERSIGGVIEYLKTIRHEVDMSPLMEGFARQFVRDYET